MSLGIEVVGLPAPQGSKRHVGNGVMVESSKRVRLWREAVKHAALDHQPYAPLLGAVDVSVVFRFPRPKGHYRTGRNAHLLREDAPTYVTSRPDLDKILRSTFDALGEAGVWRDDSQVVRVCASKVYADARPAGATVQLCDLHAGYGDPLEAKDGAA